jgi:hypothetical protein
MMSKIKIDGTAAFERSVTDVLATIRRNPVGDIIASSIENIKNRNITIVPWDAGKAAVYGECNATAHADNIRDAAPEGASGLLVGDSGWYAGHDDNRMTLADERYDRMPYGLKGTGDGSDVHINFTPDTRGRGGCGGGFYGSLPDEVLLHEMVHALRHMQGKSNPIPTEDALRKYDNEEEFLAIVVSNVYMSAKNKTQLRADHWGFKALDSALTTSAGFLADPGNFKLMNIYKLVWQPTFWLLHTVPATFNPFRELTLRLNYLTNYQPFQ